MRGTYETGGDAGGAVDLFGFEFLAIWFGAMGEDNEYHPTFPSNVLREYIQPTFRTRKLQTIHEIMQQMRQRSTAYVFRVCTMCW